MQIDKNLISRLEHLARLELSEAERESLTNDLNAILEMVAQLQDLDTDDVEPLVYINEDINQLRPDEVNNQVDVKEALKNAPDEDGAHFKVPKVIDL
ncbi:MAG: Asp-tRNA(Asn)/Glu-tRNA(Gln) amidotransferase subunit GatC [Bacteroidota bacterium]